MSEFPFKKLYEYYARQLDGRFLKSPCSDPVLMKLRTKNGRPVSASLAPTLLVLGFIVREDGQEKLSELVSNSIEKEDDSFCMLLMHEGHVKLFPGADLDTLRPLQEKGLSQDPEAQHAMMVRIFHRTGVYCGFLPIDKERRVKYAAGAGLQTEILHVKPGADQNLH